MPLSWGPVVADWIESELVHSEGDHFGEPFRLTGSQRDLLNHLYLLDDGKQRQYQTAIVGRPKGSGKTEIAAAVGLAELAGPTAPTAPVIPVAAASYEQADLLFGAARKMVANGPLIDVLEPYDKQILTRDGSGRMFRVAAIAGTNDGLRPTFVVGDELHEWAGSRARVWQVLTQGLAKRRGAWALGISTAGHDLESLLGGMYRQGLRVVSGEVEAGRFYFDWNEVPADLDVDDRDLMRAAIVELYGDLVAFVDIDRIMGQYDVLPRYEFLRYFANRWTAADKQWLPAGAWRDLELRVQPDEGSTIALGFDGSYSGDSTALVGCTVEDDPVMWVLNVWEHDGSPEWTVDRGSVMEAIHSAFETFDVVEFAPDPYGWVREIEELEGTYGERVVRFPTNSRARMAAACSRFYTAVVTGAVAHDHDARLSRHLANAHTKPYGDGLLITKDRKSSVQWIDAAIAAVVAYERATWRRDNTEATTPMVSMI